MQTPSGTYAPTDNNVPYVALPTPQDQGALGANSLLAIAWRRKLLLLFFLFCGLGVGHYFYTQEPEVFSSSALVEVFQPKTQSATDSAVEQVQDQTPSIVFIDAEIKSNRVLEKAFEIGKLSSFDSFPSDLGAAMGALRSGLKISPPFEKGSEGRDRSLVMVSYESGDPRLCAAVVDSVVQAYEEYVNGRHRGAIDSVKSFFKEARDSLIPQVNDLEEEYAKFRGDAPLEWTSSGEAINPFREDVLRLEESIDSLAGESKKLSSKLRLIEETSKAHESAVMVLREVRYLLDDMADVSSLEQALAEGTDAEVEIQQSLVPLIIEADSLRTQYGEKHPSVKSIEDKIAATRKALLDLNRTKEERKEATAEIEEKREEVAKSLLRSYVNGLVKKRNLIDEESANLVGRLDEMKERAHKLIEYENENASYTRRLARFQGMLDSFDAQLEKASLPLLNPGLQVNVLRPAGYGFKVGPQLARFLAFGAFGGFALGGLLAWLIDWSERTFRNPDEIVDQLNAEILSHMPLMRLRKRKLKEGDDPRIEKIDAAVTVIHDPHSPGSESIRQVRNTLLANSELEYQVIQVTSSMPGDGKSTIAANFGVSVAGANKRVCIVDADLRRPTQHKVLGLETTKGVTDVLNGDLELKDVIQETGIDGLYAISTGPKPSNPAEALSMPEFGQMIDDLRMQFDLVIVDTPPVLAVSDASAVAKNVDGVIFVMRIGRNSKPMAKRSMTILKNVHVNLIGIVVNAIGDSGYSASYATAWSNYYGGRPGGEYGYGYYRYGYRYRYGYGYGYNRSYGNDKYRNASRGQRVKVRGRQKINGTPQPVGEEK